MRLLGPPFLPSIFCAAGNHLSLSIRGGRNNPEKDIWSATAPSDEAAVGPSRSEGAKEGEGESAQSSERERRKWLHLAPQLDAALYRWPPSVVRVNAYGPPICKGRRVLDLHAGLDCLTSLHEDLLSVTVIWPYVCFSLCLSVWQERWEKSMACTHRSFNTRAATATGTAAAARRSQYPCPNKNRPRLWPPWPVRGASCI